jgi:hypothetical protein
MKTMTCRQLGGACEQKFSANTFDEIAAMSKQHGMEMFQKGDKAHIDAMSEMRSAMSSPDAMARWMDSRKKEFERLPDSI